jgi:activator of 2-hydroxyglutaryl-CoA dehydratase
MTGGVAQNIGVVRALEKQIGLSILLPPEPQLVGALGAALLAREKKVV